MSMYDIAREVTDEVLGKGAYAKANEGNGDPRIKEQVEISKQEADKDAHR